MCHGFRRWRGTEIADPDIGDLPSKLTEEGPASCLADFGDPLVGDQLVCNSALCHRIERLRWNRVGSGKLNQISADGHKAVNRGRHAGYQRDSGRPGQHESGQRPRPLICTSKVGAQPSEDFRDRNAIHREKLSARFRSLDEARPVCQPH
ncbi:hypothetical protein D3C87_1645470 [compost metagenome]